MKPQPLSTSYTIPCESNIVCRRHSRDGQYDSSCCCFKFKSKIVGLSTVSRGRSTATSEPRLNFRPISGGGASGASLTSRFIFLALILLTTTMASFSLAFGQSRMGFALLASSGRRMVVGKVGLKREQQQSVCLFQGCLSRMVNKGKEAFICTRATPTTKTTDMATRRYATTGSGVNGDDHIQIPSPPTSSPPSSSMSSKTAPRTITSLPPIPKNAHRFVLMRHGESEFNNANIFTGWCDVALTQRGVVEAVEAGQVFLSHGLTFRKCYASALTRSIVTAHRCLEAAGVAYTPIDYDWRLNERHYGALQGLSKERTAQRLGYDIVMQWRRSFSAKPPLMTSEHPHYGMINRDVRYWKYRCVGGNKAPFEDSDELVIPLGESLEECQERILQAWYDIVQDVKDCEVTAAASAIGDIDGEDLDDEDAANIYASPRYSMVVAHANSLRALVMYLDDIPADKIESLNIPTAIPFYYDIDLRTGKRVESSSDGKFDTESKDDEDEAAGRFSGIYISDERKKRSFLERRRAANDPFLWALHDHQVDRSMLLDDSSEKSDDGVGLEGIELEAKHNTEVFSPALKQDKSPQF